MRALRMGKNQMRFGKEIKLAVLSWAAAGLVLYGCSGSSKTNSGGSPAEAASSAQSSAAAPIAAAPDSNSIELNDKQLKAIKYSPAETHSFSQQRVAVGSIDFDENLAVQVFAPYQGRIIKAYAEIGDEVKKGQTL